MEKRKAALNLIRLVGKQALYVGKEYLMKEDLGILKINFNNYTDDKEVIDVLKEYGLEKPEKLMQFIILSNFARLDTISSQIEKVKKQFIVEALGILKGIKSNISYVNNNPEIKEKSFNSAQERLFELSGKFKEHLNDKIGEVKGIDNQSKWEFFIKAKNNKIIIDTDIELIKLCIDALETVTTTQIFIGKELGQNVDSIIIDYKEFYNTELRCGDTFRLLHSYEFKELQNQDYFLKLFDRVETIEELSKVCTQYMEEYVDSLEGYEDIVFES